MENQLLVAVWMVTYNHGEFIEKAIESVMMQKTTFQYKLFIGEDNSMDNTREICEKLKEKYADKIELFLHEENIGATPNGIFIYEQCFKSEAKYIALLEGDDYWSDLNKLQKQVDFLEANAHLSGCFHNSEERYWNDYSKASSLYLSIPFGREVSIKELTLYNMVPTASIVFKNPIPNEVFTKEFLDLSIGDWPLHLLNTRNGNYYYLPQVMSVRNLNLNSVWGMKEQQKNGEIVLGVYQRLIESNWFENDIKDLLSIGKMNLENTIRPVNDSNIKTFKRKILNKMIRFLKKL